MRVIRTELYFDEDTIRSTVRRPRFRPMHSREKSDGLAFLWFRSDSPGPYSIRSYKWFSGKEVGSTDIRIILDLLLQDIEGDDIGRFIGTQERSSNESIIDYVIDQGIIIEQSPPKAIKFKDLLKSSNTALLLGAYIGRSMAGDNPALLILTIPGGIIVVGSALGIADAMADGLNKHVKRLFSGK